MAASLNNPAWLDWMTALTAREPKGRVSRQTLASTFSPDRFYCLLDELPLHLIPRRSLKSLQRDFDANQPLYLNPECTVCRDGQLPPALAARRDLLTGFAMQGTTVWVPTSTSALPLPFWLGPQLECVVLSLSPSEPTPEFVSYSVRQRLASTGILLPERPSGQGRPEREERMQRSSLLFREKDYAPLSCLIHPFHLAALRRYYRHRIRTGAIPLGDGQSPRRYAVHNDPVARFFHFSLACVLGEIVGEPIKPSYVYFASYLSGAELKKHTDRAQCEFSITLCLDFAPEPEWESPWPIRLDTNNNSVAVYQALGDGLAYRGTKVPHYRDKLGQGQTSTSIFFHYVPTDFSGSLE